MQTCTACSSQLTPGRLPGVRAQRALRRLVVPLLDDGVHGRELRCGVLVPPLEGSREVGILADDALELGDRHGQRERAASLLPSPSSCPTSLRRAAPGGPAPANEAYGVGQLGSQEGELYLVV